MSRSRVEVGPERMIGNISCRRLDVEGKMRRMVGGRKRVVKMRRKKMVGERKRMVEKKREGRGWKNALVELEREVWSVVAAGSLFFCFGMLLFFVFVRCCLFCCLCCLLLLFCCFLFQ